ncbi:GAP family protein [Streptomyces sp. NPDC012508]|uniref:GAP family protein n=1 Tax=Streptomyces sp. NPDC012508 TaxID=3364837 RepID=UPI0036779158
MLLQAIGALLPAALAVARSPFPLIAVVLILTGRHGRRNGTLFALGWVAGLAVVATVVVVLFGAADDPDSTSSSVADWGRVVAGAALIVVGVRKWRLRPRPGDVVEEPRWMARLDGVTPWRSLRLGALLAGANPKNVVLTASAATAVVEAGPTMSISWWPSPSSCSSVPAPSSGPSPSSSPATGERRPFWTVSGGSWSPTAP